MGLTPFLSAIARILLLENVANARFRAAIQIILENGKLHKGDLAHSLKLTKNPARGAGDVRGTGAAQGSHR